MSMRIVRSGVWRYDNTLNRPVDVVALDYDFWYELARADDALEKGVEPTPLGPEGWLYYVRYAKAGEQTEPTWVDSAGYPSLTEAMAKAADPSVVPSPIRWDRA